MQQDLELESLKEVSKIAQQLKKSRQLQVINLDEDTGSFGQFFIAQHLISKQHYAIKILSIFDGFDSVSEQKLQEAKKEALFLKNANHPNIIKYIDEFQIEFNYFIVIEKCEKNLQQLLEEFIKSQATISKHQFVSLACQTLSGINYLHSQKRMPRDLQLKNILVDSLNQIKLCDFGFAKQIQEELQSSQMLTSITKDALFYYPPELIQQLETNLYQNKKGYIEDFNGDIWAFGICFYILAGASLNSCLELKTTGYQNLPNLDQSLNEILSQILSLDPSQRPNVVKLIDQFQTLREQIWTSNDASELFKEYEQKKQANQQYLAYQLIDICTQIQPKNENYWYHLGRTQNELKLHNQAINSYQKCLYINPKHDNCYGNLGNAYHDKGMLDEAINSFQKCLEINPQDNLSLKNLGYTYEAKGMLDEAINCYQKYLEINPQDAIYHYNLGIVYDDQGMLDEAINSYLKCLEINPQDDVCLMNLGNTYKSKGMLDEAINSYQKCLEINPKHDICHYNLGIAYKAEGMLDEAMNSYQKCLEINPQDGSCLMNLGIIYKNKGMLDEAINSYQKCLEINPKKDICYKNLGIAYKYKGMLDEAIKSFQNCLEINPKDDTCYFNLGNLYDDQGMLDKAINSYQKCLRINPKHSSCHYNLGFVYDDKSMLNEAIKSFSKCLKINPNDEECSDQMRIVKSKI